MGSFNIACSISGLPVVPGDEVYAMLLTRNSLGENRDVYPNDLWVPRTPAMLGTYADYGRVEFSDAPTEQVLQHIACTMLDIESVERGGAPVRGGHVRHGMGLASYLEAIEEGTLVVGCESQRSVREMNDAFESKHGEQGPPEPEIGPIPTVASVVALLERAGLAANSSSSPCFCVNEITVGEIVVSCWAWNGLKIEDASRAIEATYAAVVARGRGHDDNAVVRVFPKPKVEGLVGPGYERDDAPRLVAMAVVRADVWDALLRFRIPSWRQEGGYSLDHYLEAEHAIRDLAVGFDDEGQRDISALLRKVLNRSTLANALWENRNVLAGHIGMGSCSGGSGSPGVTGWSHHYEAWIEALASKDPSALETADGVGRRFAECCFIYDHLSTMRARVMPSQYACQDEPWAEHIAFHQAVAEIAAAEKQKADDDR